MTFLLSLSSFKHMLRRRALVIAVAILCGSILSLLYALSRPAIYEATAVIQIETPQVAAALPGGATTNLSNNRNRLKLIEQKLMSRDSVLSVVEKFDLFGADPTMSEIEKVSQLRSAVQIVELIDPSQAWRSDVQPSGLVITARLDDAQKAADIANEFLSLVLVEGKKRSESQANETLTFFQQEEDRISAAIAQLETEFARYKERHAASLPSRLTDQREQLARLLESQLELENQVIQLETNTGRLRAEERQRQSDVLSQQLQLVETRLAEINSALAEAPEVERVFSTMERQLEQLNTEYEMITSRRTEAAMTRQLESQDQFERFEVLETALVPEFSMSRGKRKIAMAGGVASVLAALGLAFLLDLLSPVMRTSRHVERELDLRPVVIIPEMKKPRRRLFARSAPVMLTAGTAMPMSFKGRVLDLFGAG